MFVVKVVSIEYKRIGVLDHKSIEVKPRKLDL